MRLSPSGDEVDVETKILLIFFSLFFPDTVFLQFVFAVLKTTSCNKEYARLFYSARSTHNTQPKTGVIETNPAWIISHIDTEERITKTS